MTLSPNVSNDSGGATGSSRFPYYFMANYYIVLGTAAIIGNVIIILLMGLVKDLRTSCNAFLINVAVVDALRGGILLWIGIQRLTKLITGGGTGISYTYMSCFWKNVKSVFSYPLGVAVLLIVAIERVVAVGKPVWYRSHSNTLAYVLIPLVWVFHILVAVAAYFTIPGDKKMTVPCNTFNLLVGWFESFWDNLVTIYSLGTMILYGIVLGTIHKRKKNEPESQGGELSRTARATRSITIVIIIFAVTWIGYFLWKRVVVVYVPNGKLYLSVWAGLFAPINHSSNFFIYVLTSSPFRKAIFTSLGIQKPTWATTVHSLPPTKATAL